MPPYYKWEKIKAEGPRARDSHTCVPFMDHLILFGGGNGKDASFGDLYKFSLKSRLWTKIEVHGGVNGSPAPREAHICQTLGELVILHGGLNQKEESFDDTWVLTGLVKRLDLNNVNTASKSAFDDNVKPNGPTGVAADQPPLY